MTNLTEQEVYIGGLGQQKVYLNWSDVKDICTNAVAEAYEQVKEENTKLKELLKECKEYIGDVEVEADSIEMKKACGLIAEIDQVLGEE